jgi:hypothetical protein
LNTSLKFALSVQQFPFPFSKNSRIEMLELRSMEIEIYVSLWFSTIHWSSTNYKNQKQGNNMNNKKSDRCEVSYTITGIHIPITTWPVKEQKKKKLHRLMRFHIFTNGALDLQRNPSDREQKKKESIKRHATTD